MEATLNFPLRILDRRMKNGRIQYQVEWSDTTSEPTWEKRKNLKEDGYMQLIKDYETIQKSIGESGGNDGGNGEEKRIKSSSSRKSKSPKSQKTMARTTVAITNETIDHLRTPSPVRTNTRGRTAYSTTAKGNRQSLGRGRGRGRSSISKTRQSISGRTSISTTRRNRLSVSAPKPRTSISRTRKGRTSTSPKKKKTNNEQLQANSTPEPERRKLSMGDSDIKKTKTNTSSARRCHSISLSRRTTSKSPSSKISKEENDVTEKKEKFQPYRGPYKFLQKYFFKRCVWSDALFISIVLISLIVSACAPNVPTCNYQTVQAYCNLAAVSVLFIESMRRKDTSATAKSLQICLTWRLVSDGIGIGMPSVQETFSDLISFLRTISNLSAFASTLLLLFSKSHKVDVVVLLPSIFGTVLLFMMQILEIGYDNSKLNKERSPITIFALIILLISVIASKTGSKKHRHHHTPHHEMEVVHAEEADLSVN